MIDFLLGVPGKLKAISDYLTTNMASARMALIDNLTALRVAKIDNLDAAISTRALGSTALSNATWTNSLAAKLAAPNPFLSNPRYMPLVLIDQDALAVKTALAATTDTGVAGAFTSLAKGGSSAQITASGTWATLCNISGAGFLTHVISAQTGANTTTVSMRITIDGVAYTFTSPTLILYHRMVLGVLLINGTPEIGGGSDDGFVTQSGGFAINTSSRALVIPTPHQVIARGLPALRFETSLLVEIMSSMISGIVDPNRYGYVGYRLDVTA